MFRIVGMVLIATAVRLDTEQQLRRIVAIQHEMATLALTMHADARIRAKREGEKEPIRAQAEEERLGGNDAPGALKFLCQYVKEVSCSLYLPDKSNTILLSRVRGI